MEALSSNEIIENYIEKLIYGSFKVGSMEVALDVKLVQEVVNYPETVTKMPLPTPYLEGIFNLRGAIIPIVNLRELLGLGEIEITGTEKVAIVECQGAKIGLVFDSTSEILRISKEDIVPHSKENAQDAFMSGCIKLHEDSRMLHVLNIDSLVKISNISDLLTKQKISTGVLTHKDFQRNMKKCISFSVGSLQMSFEITGINEVIKVTELKESHVQCDLCLGVVELRGLVIPIIDINFYLEGTGYRLSDVVDQKIIILRNQEICIGLLVDSVESILSFSENDLMPIPIFREKYKELFAGCISKEGEGDIVLLDHRVILDNPEIIEISKGHDLIYNKDYKDENSQRKQVINQSFISFTLGDMYGFEIGDIREIISYPKEISPSPGASSYIKGVLNLRGDAVTIVDTRKLYSMNSVEIDYEKSKILIFEAGEKLVGLIVDSLESIVTIDINSKIILPKIVTRDLESKFGKDLKEVITYNAGEEKDRVLTVLNVENIALRF
ncbi:putative chemotaxis protein [Halobacteriovorax marinus SJ]|uniref:Chemotaxis protein n=1 Tax=Halobacteriovorax marinus (strain ATCC BAA-682 / DSM 15412 / SJ) TaxID=862908 RepID=E1WYB5_HALMS|nr:chemotaxis protein CheW [Halobacteriovorax marinus]CBW25963.1 putative chemotaxis protein [Halobacteriovorax marinus SJ]